MRCPKAIFVPLTSVTLCMCVLLTLFGIQAPLATAQSPSFVRIIHASPYVGTADVFVDGTKLLSSFAFGSVTDYAPIPPGPHRVQIALIGQGINASAINQTLDVSPGLAYTVAAIGATPASLSLEVFVDNNLVTPGSAKLRLYHLSPNAGPLSLAARSNTLISGITYQQASNYLALSSGSYTLDVNATQINTSLSLPTNLNANTVTSLFTVGMFNATPKLELVSTQVNALPGMPGTGSDPGAPPTNQQPTYSWLLWLPRLLGALVLVCIGAAVIARRRTASL